MSSIAEVVAAKPYNTPPSLAKLEVLAAMVDARNREVISEEEFGQLLDHCFVDIGIDLA